jgi:acyl carrier protein
MTNYPRELREFIVENFLYGQEDEQLSNSASLLALGIIDSTGVMELVNFLEQRYQITIDDEELIPANLDSIDRLVLFITQKIKVPA